MESYIQDIIIYLKEAHKGKISLMLQFDTVDSHEPTVLQGSPSSRGTKRSTSCLTPQSLVPTLL